MLVLVCATIGIAIATIQVRTTIVQTMNDITETQAVIKEKEDNGLLNWNKKEANFLNQIESKMSLKMD